MKGKLLFATGLAVGYVLGARAGRKRYEQIAAAANKVWQTPGIQKQVHAAQDFAAEKIGDIPGAVFDGARKAATSAINAAQKKTTGKSPSDQQAARNAAAWAASRESAAETESTSEPLDS
jgi:oxygen-dependent protoporphyrinogen oxidase